MCFYAFGSVSRSMAIEQICRSLSERRSKNRIALDHKRQGSWLRANFVALFRNETEHHAQWAGNLGKCRLIKETTMADYDIIIKGGTVVDGTRTPRYVSDIAIKDGRSPRSAA